MGFFNLQKLFFRKLVNCNAIIRTDCHTYFAAFADLGISYRTDFIHNNQHIVRTGNAAFFTSSTIICVNIDVAVHNFFLFIFFLSSEKRT